ncbi:hypothetical protein ACRAWD_28800 [Caulobacter segnis]
MLPVLRRPADLCRDRLLCAGLRAAPAWHGTDQGQARRRDPRRSCDPRPWRRAASGFPDLGERWYEGYPGWATSSASRRSRGSCPILLGVAALFEAARD